MKKLLVLSLVVLFTFGNYAFAYPSASSLRSDLNRIKGDISSNQRKIYSIKNSSRISEYDKKRQIQKLERENHSLKQKYSRIKREYSRAIS